MRTISPFAFTTLVAMLHANLCNTTSFSLFNVSQLFQFLALFATIRLCLCIHSLCKLTRTSCIVYVARSAPSQPLDLVGSLQHQLHPSDYRQEVIPCSTSHGSDCFVISNDPKSKPINLQNFRSQRSRNVFLL
jgi:hypothetical protein